MNKINLITPPDILPNDSYQLLVMYPSKTLQKELQETFLSKAEFSVNVYYYDKLNYNNDDVNWLLTIFKLCDTAIIDVDNVAPYAKDLLSYMIAKDKTYWLTNTQNSVYNNLSNNRVFTLEFMSAIGDKDFETE